MHAKFTIVDFIPGQPILYQTTSNASGWFTAYGSASFTNSDTRFSISRARNTILIAPHQVPIIGDIQFNEESFANRVAKVKNKEVFYMLLNPTTQETVAEMVFEVPA